MSTHGRPKSRRQMRHPGSRGKSHWEDKQRGEARRQTTFVPVPSPEHPSPRRVFGPLHGHEYTFNGRNWKRCEGGEEFGDFLERQAELRGWYRSQTKRKGVAVEMKRQVAAPIEVLTTTFSPWLSDWTADEIAAKRDPRKALAAIRTKWLENAQRLLRGLRFFLGYAFHCDTDDPHFDLCVTRQDGRGGRIGKPGLQLVGPWCCGTDAQLRAGADISPHKSHQMKNSVANFRHRYGENAVPLDVSLARALDAAAEAVIGPELLNYRRAYAQRVPELERKHTAAQLAALQAAEAKLRDRLEPEPRPEPAAPEPENNLPPL